LHRDTNVIPLANFAMLARRKWYSADVPRCKHWAPWPSSGAGDGTVRALVPGMTLETQESVRLRALERGAIIGTLDVRGCSQSVTYTDAGGMVVGLWIGRRSKVRPALGPMPLDFSSPRMGVER
jgi:hypothetical protein